MGLIEVSIIYGLVTSQLKGSFSMAISAILFGAVCLIGLLTSPLGISTGIQIAIAAWFCFNLSFFSWIFLPNLLVKRLT
ncbi:hypothetical protein C0081_03555 [Cohaesibacter celericrescens]|uniref:Uncharacterized protein n=1 Tax=Cohaesibacter celericrescens TaxID=2067669 RepID=A0A2N5XW05_9HYPH|nr:hypothetical protein C0081_03555 [Cohaesibacter celericrescens]